MNTVRSRFAYGPARTSSKRKRSRRNTLPVFDGIENLDVGAEEDDAGTVDEKGYEGYEEDGERLLLRLRPLKLLLP